jgi:hypothetical protein
MVLISVHVSTEIDKQGQVLIDAVQCKYGTIDRVFNGECLY